QKKMTPVKDRNGWVRPLGSKELLFEEAHNAGCLNTCYTITINAQAPVLETQVQQALVHLYRKVPNLRMSIQKFDDGTHWWREMSRDNTDFVFLNKADLEDELQKMLSYHFDVSNGPMWCVRLIQARSEDLCIMESIKQQFTYQYYLNYCIHHSISDGFTNMNIIGFFLKILNSVIAGEYIDDEAQLAYHDDGSQTNKRVEMKRNEFELNPDVKANKIAIISERKNKPPLLTKVYPANTLITPCTRAITVNLDKETTKKFLTKCKTEKVSAHAGLCALSNAALAAIMKDKGLEEDSYEVNMEHSINLRRYWEGDTSKAFGPHVSNITQISNITKDVHEMIWSYARSIQDEFYAQLNNDEVFEWGLLTESSKPPETPRFQSPPTPFRDYFISNMGNIDSMIPDNLHHIQMTHIRRVTAIHLLGSAMSQNMQTLRGHFLYSCNFCPHYISADTAHLYVKKLFKKLRDQI
ncbi:unnamed protein product, partial [Meganyctiphanes norvegica]